MRRESIRLHTSTPFRVALAGGVFTLAATAPMPAAAQWGQTARDGAEHHSGYVVADDSVRLYYEVVGSGSPVVIVPGGLFLERDFTRLANGRTVVFYDMRDRGRSDHVADSARISIERDVRDLEMVRREMGAERFIPVGWSYLGMMVMRYAAAYPEHVSRIVQIGPLGRVTPTRYPDSLVAHDRVPVPDPASIAELARLRAEGLAERDQRAYCDRDYQINRVRLVGDPKLAVQVPDLCDMPNEWPANQERHGRLLFTSIVAMEPPGWERFARLDIPVLIIHGTQDRNAPYGGGREWAAHLPQARLLTIRSAAHMPWLDAPGLVYPALEEFLRGAWPRAAASVPH